MSPLLLVSNLTASLEFYTKKLGFEINFRYDDFYAGIMKDGNGIHLKTGKPNMAERADRRKNEDPDIIFSVERIEEQYQKIGTDSVSITQALREMPYGKEFYLTDADGYILAFVEAV